MSNYSEQLRITSNSAIHQGMREYQQDVMASSGATPNGSLWVLCDGMGGMADGDKFATIGCNEAISAFLSLEAKNLPMYQVLLACYGYAQRATQKIQDKANRGGSTMLLIYIRNGMCSYLSVGDSRIYLMRNNGLIQLTHDQELGATLDTRAALGDVDMEVARTAKNRAALTNHLGKDDPLPADLCSVPFTLKKGDRIMQMSDGVFGTISNDEILFHAKGSVDTACKNMIDAVILKKKPHQDNCSVQMVFVD